MAGCLSVKLVVALNCCFKMASIRWLRSSVFTSWLALWRDSCPSLDECTDLIVRSYTATSVVTRRNVIT